MFLHCALFFFPARGTLRRMAHASDAPTRPPIPLSPLTLADFKSETVRGAPGFFRVGQTFAGQWWLIDAEDRAFFSRGVNAVGSGVRPALAAMADSFPPMGDADALDSAAATRARLRAWRVNTLGPWSAPDVAGREFASTETLEFTKVAPQTTIRLGGALVPDVFDPEWIEACDRQAAEQCAPSRAEAALIGYFTDDELNWAQLPAEENQASATRPGRPSLLQICLSLEPSFPAYHAAWEFTLAAHGGDWASLVRAWDLDLPNKEALRQRTLADAPLASAGYRRDQERFSREFARRYFAASAAAIRRHDPHHLILGCRFGASPGPAILAECAAPHVDVLSLSQGELSLCDEVTGPVLAGAFSWVKESFTARTPGATDGWTSVERMLQRGRATLARAFAHPALIGYAWECWADGPDDRPPFGRGLVHVDGSEAREHTELLSDLNARADFLRRAAAPNSPVP